MVVKLQHFFKKEISIDITHREQKAYRLYKWKTRTERKSGKIIFFTLMRLKVRTDTHKSFSELPHAVPTAHAWGPHWRETWMRSKALSVWNSANLNYVLSDRWIDIYIYCIYIHRERERENMAPYREVHCNLREEGLGIQNTAGGSAGACVHVCVHAYTHPHTEQMNPTFHHCEWWNEKLVRPTADILAQNQIRSLSWEWTRIFFFLSKMGHTRVDHLYKKQMQAEWQTIKRMLPEYTFPWLSELRVQRRIFKCLILPQPLQGLWSDYLLRYDAQFVITWK